ncbi:ZIP zinc/iron transport family, partial [Aureobasidium melanogenum]
MSSCTADNHYDGRMGVRISAIFVIGVCSLFATWFPVFAARHRGVGVPDWAFFIAKYFGSGVIIATSFIHLLAPANDALTDPCLTGPITEYDWVEGIVLMTIFVLFFVELMTMRYAKFGHSHEHDDLEPQDELGIKPEPFTDGKKPEIHDHADPAYEMPGRVSTSTAHCPTTPHARGDDHLGHARSHVDNEISAGWTEAQKQAADSAVSESYAAQMTALFILEFGVIFHSIFIGLTLAVSGSEFTTLYVVLVFHQSFEGLGLGTRLAAIPWPESKRWSPYLLGAGYAISTPIAIAIGLGVRQSFAPGSQTTLIANGVFDSISAGILIYTGLVELMAHEFMFSTYMQKASIKTVLTAFLMMCLGAGLMALLGKWA